VTGSSVETLGGHFYLSINSDGAYINGVSMVTAATLAGGALDYDNGVVHLIDRTLVPATDDIVSIAVSASQASEGAEFGQLVAALTAVEQDMSTDALVTILSGDGPFTVFAPTDAAFQALYELAGVADFSALVEAVGIGTIEVVLKYHVLGSKVFSKDIPNALDGNASVAISPLMEGSFTINNDFTITDSDAALGLGTSDASIVTTDILGTNGVIHVIDNVILP
jgi:transforming growth factor-beta-induced protein